MKQLTDKVFAQVRLACEYAALDRPTLCGPALDALDNAQPEPHLFEFWWAEYMPESTQEQAFKAWSAAPSSKGVAVGQQAQPERGPSDAEIEAMWASENGLEDCELCKRFDFIKAAKYFYAKQGGQHD